MTAPVRVLFIGGWGRSGSTLLDRMLAGSLGFFASGELREIWYRGVTEDRLCGCGLAFSECRFWNTVGTAAFGGWDQEDADRREAMRLALDRPWHLPLLMFPALYPPYRRRHAEYSRLLGRLYGAIAEVSGAPVVVDSSKIPTYAMLLNRVPGIDLRILHLVRDSRGVVNSWQKQVARHDGGGVDEMYRYGLASATFRYDLYNGLAQTFARWRTPYLRVRYEDLVREPLTTLEEIGRFAWNHPILDAGDLERGAVTFATDHTVDGNPIRFQKGRVELRLDDEWKRALDLQTRRKVTALTAPLLAAYGYPLRSGGRP
jgi:hypothetical protein